MYIDEYVYNSCYSHIIYISNETLIINNNINIRDYIVMLDYTKIGNYNNIYVIKNNNDVNLLNIEEIKKKSKLVIKKEVGITENITSFKNDSVENKEFLERMEILKFLFFVSTRTKKLILKNHTYNRIYYKIKYDKNYLDINIDKKLNYGNFEAFNPNKDIAFVTLYTDDILYEGVEMEHNFKNYCEKNDYTFYIHRKSELEGKKHPCFEKPYLLERYIKKHKYIVWVDSDTLITDLDFKIESIFIDNFDVITYKDYGDNFKKINTGVMGFKNTETSYNIIKRWISDIENCDETELFGPTQGDQGLLNKLIVDYEGKYIINNNDKLNTPLDFLNIDTKIIHFMGIYGFIRHILMEYFNYLIIKNKMNEYANELF